MWRNLENNVYFECVSSVGVISMTAADACLVAHQRSYFLELLTIHITVAIQVKHLKSNFEMALGRCAEEKNELVK